MKFKEAICNIRPIYSRGGFLGIKCEGSLLVASLSVIAIDPFI